MKSPLGRTEIYGNLGNEDLTTVSALNGRIIETVTGTGEHKQYIVEDAQRDEGIALASGNYANPILSNTSLNDAVYSNQAGATYTITPSDRGKTVSMESASANTVTIDTNANQACPVNMVCLIAQDGAGVTTLNSVLGVTVNGVSGDAFTFDFSAQYQAISIEQKSLNNWIVRGI